MLSGGSCLLLAEATQASSRLISRCSKADSVVAFRRAGQVRSEKQKVPHTFTKKQRASCLIWNTSLPSCPMPIAAAARQLQIISVSSHAEPVQMMTEGETGKKKALVFTANKNVYEKERTQAKWWIRLRKLYRYRCDLIRFIQIVMLL